MESIIIVIITKIHFVLHQDMTANAKMKTEEVHVSYIHRQNYVTETQLFLTER